MREVRVLTLRYPMFPNSVDGQEVETSWLVQRCRSTLLCSVQCAGKGRHMGGGCRVEITEAKESGTSVYSYKGVRSECPVIYYLGSPPDQ